MTEEEVDEQLAAALGDLVAAGHDVPALMERYSWETLMVLAASVGVARWRFATQIMGAISGKPSSQGASRRRSSIAAAERRDADLARLKRAASSLGLGIQVQEG